MISCLGVVAIRASFLLKKVAFFDELFCLGRAEEFQADKKRQTSNNKVEKDAKQGETKI